MLPTVQVPTPVLHRRESRLVSTEVVRWFAGQIPNSRYVELDGGDALPYVGDAEALVDQIEAFLTGATGGAVGQRVLATVLFADIVGSTPLPQTLGDRRWQDLLDEYYRNVRRLLERFRGQEIQTSGDGFIATFDASPTEAVTR